MLFFVQLIFFYSIRLGFAHMDHSIEEGTAEATFDLLVDPATRLQLVADEVLIAIDLRFGQRASMIATGLFPLLASPFVVWPAGFHRAPTGGPYNYHADGL